MAAKKEPKGNEEKRLSAVIIAENFDLRLSPFSKNNSFSLHRVCDRKLIEHTLEWVSNTEIRDVIVVLSEQSQLPFKEITSKWSVRFDSVNMVVCREAHSVGDALREVFTRNLLSYHFLLIPHPAIFCSSNLKKEIDKFRSRWKSSRNNVMSLIYSKSSGKTTSVAVRTDNDKLLAYHQASDPSRLDHDKEIVGEFRVVRQDIIDSYIAICSMQILAHFTDNFDFQNRDDVIREILANEEILCQNIYVDVLGDNDAAFPVTDYAGLVWASRLLIGRWLFPLAPGTDEGIIHDTRNIYRSALSDRIDVSGWNMFLGRDVSVGRDCHIENSSIGEETSLGENCHVKESVIGRGCRIGKGCQLREVFIGERVHVGEGVSVPPKTVLANDVEVGVEPPAGCLLSTVQATEDEEELVLVEQLSPGLYVWKLKGSEWWDGLARPSMAKADTVSLTQSEQEKGESAPPANDDLGQFVEEISESMEQTFDGGAHKEQVPNLILEINSSKLAYNISMEDVAKHVFLCFIRLPGHDKFVTMKQNMIIWKQLFKNYYQPKQCQYALLVAIHTHADTCVAFAPMVPKLIHFLYDELEVLEDLAIFEWHSDLKDADPLKAAVQPIIDWLEESDDDSDESS